MVRKYTKKKPADDIEPIDPPSIHGGKRAGSGQKDKATRVATKNHHVDYTKARAKNEQYKADMAQLDFKIKSLEYVERAAVRQAAATAFAATAQTLRSIPDNLERRLGVSPEVAENVGNMIDECMSDLSEQLQKIHLENTDGK